MEHAENLENTERDKHIENTEKTKHIRKIQNICKMQNKNMWKSLKIQTILKMLNIS